MFSRISLSAAALALSAIAVPSAFAGVSGTLLITLPVPGQVQSVCFTRLWVGHWSPLFSRRCASGEKPFTVTEIVPGPY